MSKSMIPFDRTRERARDALIGVDIPPEAGDFYFVRDLFGKVRVCASDRIEEDTPARRQLESLASRLSERLGPHGYPADRGVLFLSDSMLETFEDTRADVENFEGVYWIERLMVGGEWWTVAELRPNRRAKRWTLFSITGGLGRSAAAAVLARDLAQRGEKVLVVDLDLESPGVSSAVLDADTPPEFGVADWFVEDLVEQGDRVIERMTGEPEWARTLNTGKVWVAPAHGADPGEYLAKLGRVYMDRRKSPWIARLRKLLDGLEAAHSPTVVLIDSRAGFHDIAAAAVTGVDADVLLFATGAEDCWRNYGILFRHWREKGLADAICDRLEVVSALTPPDDTGNYLQRFQQRAWKSFAHDLYGYPADYKKRRFMPRKRERITLRAPLAIHWSRDLAAGGSLDRLDAAASKEAYGAFLSRFDPARIAASGGGTG